MNAYVAANVNDDMDDDIEDDITILAHFLIAQHQRWASFLLVFSPFLICISPFIF